MTFVEIESIEELKEVEDVFDITVENNHNFFANGLLVHNCLGGIYAGDYWRNIESGDEAVLNSMRETTQKMQSIFGNRWLAELQWIKHPDQHKMHKFILQVAKEMNVPIISTCDSHYPTPDTWKDRVLYKKLNPKFMNKEMESSLPMDIDEVGYELYPKNGDQMWEAYKHYSQFADFSYDDDIILGSIEKTYEIAHEWIEDFTPDNTVKLPSFVIPEGKTADQSLREMAEFELAKMGLDSDSDDSKRYMKQLDKELNIISARGFSSYFLTMKQISDIAREHVLVGPGRGCFVPASLVKMSDGFYSPIENLQIGDEVIDAYGEKQKIIDTFVYDVDEEIVKLDFGEGIIIECTKEHKILTSNRGWVEAQFLKEEDDVIEV